MVNKFVRIVTHLEGHLTIKLFNTDHIVLQGLVTNKNISPLSECLSPPNFAE